MAETAATEGFQSLFLWKVIVEHVNQRSLPPHLEFQSLFLWKVIVETLVAIILTSSLQVSILVFMEGHRRDISIYFHLLAILSFNPCFYGRSS